WQRPIRTKQAKTVYGQLTQTRSIITRHCRERRRGKRHAGSLPHAQGFIPWRTGTPQRLARTRPSIQPSQHTEQVMGVGVVAQVFPEPLGQADRINPGRIKPSARSMFYFAVYTAHGLAFTPPGVRPG